MDVNNISTINASRINLNTASRAFEAAKKEPQKETVDFKQEDMNLMDAPKKPQIDVDDIQKHASILGETLSIDDINYGLMYGRSVIADYSA